LDKTTVNVGTTVVDERLHQSITLRNNGGLGTNYRLVKSSLYRAEQAENQQEQNKTKQATSPSEKEAANGAGWSANTQ
jgi:ribosomal protein S2